MKIPNVELHVWHFHYQLSVIKKDTSETMFEGVLTKPNS